MSGKVQQDEKNKIELSIAHISPSPKPAIESLIFWGGRAGKKGGEWERWGKGEWGVVGK